MSKSQTIPLNTRIKKPLPILIGFSLILFIILQAVDNYCFDGAFYKRIYTELDTASTIGISEDDLEHATIVLLDYIQDKRDDLDVVVTVAPGQQEQMFNEREVLHMIDVKALYQGAMLIKWICLGIVLLGLLVMFRRFDFKRAVTHLFRGYRFSLIVFGIFVLALGAFVLIDFDRFWTLFHHVFFRNDLWILNPETDRMILMVPSYFFNTLVKRIVTGSLGGMLLAGILLWLGKRFSGPRYSGTTDGF